jgi:hypothetical protein
MVWSTQRLIPLRKECAMAKDTMMPTSRASLCALGEYLRRHCFFAPLREQVQIPQKMVRYRPVEKVLDGLLGILCGAKTLAQSNVTIRVDPAVQRAFGRTGCAEQSTIARTLQASTAETVAQLSRVSWYDLKRYGQTPHHRLLSTRGVGTSVVMCDAARRLAQPRRRGPAEASRGGTPQAQAYTFPRAPTVCGPDAQTALCPVLSLR